MKRGKSARVRLVLAAAVASALNWAADGVASITFTSTSSTVTLTHDPDLSSTTVAPYVVTPTSVPTASTIYPSSAYQLTKTFTSGTSNSYAAGSLGQVTNSTTASFNLATGTGVSQTDPGAVYPGASSLLFNVDLWWAVGSGGFGPLANGYASFTVGGTLGTSAEVLVNLSFKDAGGTKLRTDWVVDQLFPPGTFPTTFTTSKVLGTGTMASGTKLHLVGTIEFRASNDEGPTDFQFSRAEFGGTPPTATFKTDVDGEWLDTANWETIDPAEDGLRSIANAPGIRALFIGTAGAHTSHTVSLSNTVTLGTLDVDGDTPYVFASASPGAFNFQAQTSEGKTVINIRPTDGDSAILVPVNLSNSMDVHTQGLGKLGFTNTISGIGGLTKMGSGEVLLLGANNTFSGGVSVVEGSLSADAAGALGTGQVTVDGGTLFYNAAGASGLPVVVNSGTAYLNVSPGPGDQFDIRAGGAIDGVPSIVAGMTVGGNLLLAPQAMIIHHNPDNLNEGNPSGLANSGQYIYGVSGNFPVPSMVVGTGSGTPWRGVGGGVGENDFGTDFGILQTAGLAGVSAVPAGLLRVHSTVVGNSGLTKIGGGTVQLLNRNNNWTGGLTVTKGTLAAAGDNALSGEPNAINNNNITLAGGTFRADGILSGNGMLLMSFFNNDYGDQRRYWNPIGTGEGRLFNLPADGVMESIGAVKVSDQGQNGPDIRQLSRGVISNHENLSVMWTGQLTVSPAEAGLWQWATTSDDGSAIWIDLNNNGVFENTGNSATTELIVDNNEYQGPTFRDNNDAARQGHPNLNLAAGVYQIAIGWSEGGVSGEMAASFRSPSRPALTLINPSDPSQAGMWSFANDDQSAKYDASFVASNVTVSSGSSSGIEVNARSAAFGTLTLGNNSTLTVTGNGPVTFAGTTATGNVTIDNTVEVKPGVFGGSVSTLTKRGVGRLVLDNINSTSGLSAASTVSIQVGSLLARTQGGVSTIGNAAISLEGGTFVAQGAGGAQNALRGSAHASTDVRVNTSALSSPNLGTSSASEFDLFLWGGDPVFNAHFAAALPDQFSAMWTGEFVALHTGNHYFKSLVGDDNVAMWVDKNQNGIFENDGDSRNPIAPGNSELVNHRECCGDSLESVGIFLKAGERYKVAFGVQDTGGGSGFGAQIREPGGSLVTINPFEQPGRWVINPLDGGNTPWLADVANFTANPVRVILDSAIDVQAASANFGALFLSDHATLTVKGVGPAMFGDVLANGTVGIETQMHAFLGRLATATGINAIVKSGEAQLILDGNGASALGAASQVQVNGGTLVATNSGGNNPLGLAGVVLANNTGLMLSSKAVGNVTFGNVVSASGNIDLSAGNRGRGAIDGGNVTLTTLALSGTSNVNLGVGNNYALTAANLNIGGVATLNNNSSDNKITVGNITGTGNVTFAGNNRTRLTGNVSASALAIKNPAVDVDGGVGTRTVNVPNTDVYGRLHVQSGTIDFGSNTITGRGYLPGLNETWVTNNSFYEDTNLSPDGTSRFAMGRQLGLRQANGVNVDSNNGWRLGWTDNNTYIYSGQIFVADNDVPNDGIGRVSLAEQFDDNVLIRIDGTQRLRDTQWDNATTTNIMTLPAGWHDIDIRVGQGGGGAGPSGQQNWPGNFGVVLDTQGRGDLDPAHYAVPVDPGDGTLFRSPTAAAIDIDAGTELKAGRLVSLNSVNFNGAGTSKLTLASQPALVVSDVAALNANAGTATLNLGANNTLNANNLTVADNVTFEKSGAGTLRVGVSHSLGTNAILNVNAGKLILNSAGAGSGAVIVHNSGTLGGTGSLAGTATIQSSGHLAPGDGVGTITLGGLSLEGGANLDIEGQGSAPNVIDRINVTNPNTFILPVSGTATINLIDLGGIYTPGDYLLIDYDGSPLSDADVSNKLHVSGNIGFGTSILNDSANTRIILRLLEPGFPQWNVDADGSWSVAGNWSGNIPNGADKIANFLGKITGPHTVTLDGNKQVHNLNFDNSNKYTIAPGSGGTLTVGDGTSGGIDVQQGSHVISAGLAFSGNVTKTGPGTLTISGAQAHLAGSILNVKRGVVNLNSNAGDGTAVNSKLTLTVSGLGDGTSARVNIGSAQSFSALNVNTTDTGSQTVDLNSAVLAGSFNPVTVFASDLVAAKAALWNAICNANVAGAADPVDGIIDSHLHANSGIGMAVSGDHVSIRSTRIGDLNLDGSVTIADFIQLASHFNQAGTWQEGDLNYDGNITIADFINLASNFNQNYGGEALAISSADQAMLADFAAAHGSDVPEPGALGWMMAGMAWLGRRKRRAD